MAIRETPKSLVDALQMIKSSGWATVQEMAEWAGMDDASVYAWLAPGGPEPKWNSIRLIVRHCGDHRIQMALVQAFVSGTPILCTHGDCERVDADAKAILAKVVDTFADFAEFATEAKTAVIDGHITTVELARIRKEAEEAKRSIDSILKAAETASEKKPPSGPRLAV
jgi:hypothetical protein